jgi:glycosyltransferase involved in cell wall biosynthesis
MKILLLYEDMPQVGLAAANRIVLYTKGLLETDVEAKIVAPFGFRVKVDMDINQSGYFNGAPYTFVSFLPYHPRWKYPLLIAGLIFYYKKWLGYTRLLLQLLFNRRSYDLLFIYEFSVLYTFLLQIVSCGKPNVLESCEIPFVDLNEPFKTKKRKQREKLNFRFADGFLVISEALIKYLGNLGIPQDKLLKIPILTNISRDESNKKSTNRYKIPYILHIGSLTQQKDGIFTILEAFGKAKPLFKKEIHYYFTGDFSKYSDSDTFHKLINQYHLQGSITFLGYISQIQLDELLDNASLAIIYKEPNEQNMYCFPTKLGDYLSHGIPTIITDVGEMANYVVNGEHGWVIEACDVELLINKMVDVVNLPESKKIHQNSKQLAKNSFNYQIHAVRLKVFFEHLVNTRKE